MLFMTSVEMGVGMEEQSANSCPGGLYANAHQASRLRCIGRSLLRLPVVLAGVLVFLTASMAGQTKPKGEIDLVGYAHTDLSWLWPRSETIHEVYPRTIESVFKMAQDHPGMIYAQSAAQAYQWTERYYPDLFTQISQKIAAGEWEVVGGSWTEHDTNIPSGESLVRQHLYAKRYFKQKFGVDVKIGWLPDSFGFNWNLPQIYRKSGIDYFVTHKLKWQVERNNPPIPFPYHLFWWEGPDGSRVLAFHTVGMGRAIMGEAPCPI
jgi:alpha-mannosidase